MDSQWTDFALEQHKSISTSEMKVKSYCSAGEADFDIGKRGLTNCHDSEQQT
jgi:hypothetical protein